MSWLDRYVRPRFRQMLGPAGTLDGQRSQCPSCQQVLFAQALNKALRVCLHCGHHLRVSAQDRVKWTLDPGFSRLDLPRTSTDPLGFRDQKAYLDRLREAHAKTGLGDALVAAHGTIDGQPVVVVAMAFEFMGGSMGAAVGEGLVVAAQHAVRRAAALIVFTASGGARMQEGAISLMQMPRTTIARLSVREAGLPFIVVMTDPTMGGVSASFASLGDISIAEPDALIGFAGARVIKQTVRHTLPADFQRAESLLAHGHLDMIVKRAEMRLMLARLIGLLTQKGATDIRLAADTEEEALTW